ncbi:MAG: hypothetical protein ACUVR5_08650 [Armatimonadota bacterium]
MKRFLVILSVVLALAASAWAQTVTYQTITVWNDPNLAGYPPNAADYDWLGAKGRLTQGSGWSWLNPPSYTAIVFSQLAEGGAPSPPGAFYCKHGTSYQKIDQSWLGTDNYLGVKASDITHLSYYTYTTIKGWGAANAPNSCHDWDHMVQQPIHLEITFKPSPESNKYIHLIHRPWGLKGERRSFYSFEVWQYWDALAPDQIWWDALPENGGSEEGSYGNWDYFFNPITGKYPEAVIAAPCSGEYNGQWGENECTPTSSYRTATGKSFNLVVGAHDFTVTYPGSPTSSAWWMESDYFEGYADNLTIGVRDAQGNETVTTWDFERYNPQYYADNNQPVGKTFGIKNADRDRPAVYGNARYRNYFVMWGKVIDASEAPNKFTIDDGSGNPVLVIASGADAFVMQNDYVRVEGAVSKRRTPCRQYQIGYYFTAKPEGVWIIDRPFF